MIVVYVFAEGQTEERFIKDVVAPSLSYSGIYLKPMLIPTSKSAKGGAVSYERFLKHATHILKQQNDTYLTSFLDFYQLDSHFPKFDELDKQNGIYNKIQHLETAFHADLISKVGCRAERFIPHIQPHEFEALLFSDVNKFSDVEPEWSSHISKLEGICKQYENPEHINNSFATAPSKRLENLLIPKYRKTRHGPLLAQSITLDVIESKCPHFKEWMDKLRKLKSI
ncbi:hypothetical protein BMT54_04260 [Pasteurellaceae bacterium 15-036681]|nr:hypothetical protein BMT54_04260 [Pasteurellaceae bacterium 15-036681]